MGGNALKCGSIRMNRELYDEAVDSLTADCEGSLQELHYSTILTIPSYKDKSDFGDIDLICYPSVGKNLPELKKTLTDIYGATEFVKNGNVISFDLRVVGLESQLEFPEEGPAIQVDLMEFSDYSTLWFARNYFSYNDLGNLIGRVANNQGFKFGHDGLTYKFMHGTYLHKEITLTTDFGMALEFLGYDENIFADGFDSIEDVFNYAASSQYFHPDIFLLENRNGEARRRDQKRKTYRSFLEWCERNRDVLTKYEFSRDKTPYLLKAFQAFPGFEMAYRQCVHEVYVGQALKKEFNGSIVGNQTGFTDKKLGKFMEHVRASFGSDALFEQKLLWTPEEVWSRVYSLEVAFRDNWEG